MKRFLTIFTILLTFICFTGCPSPNTPIPEPPSVSCDWLFVMYLDADNNLNDTLWADMANAQIGLLAMHNNDGSLKDGFPNVKVVVLWDGWDATSCGNNSKTRIHPRSEIYELGPMDDTMWDKIFSSNTENRDSSWLISSNSKRLTDYASYTWLSSEPDMGDVNTLTSFLAWVNRYYSATNKVLVLSNHGAGTEVETSSGGYGVRSLCSDDTNGTNKKLTAIDVKNAISNSGFRPNILYMDCCLQANVETTYMLRGCADYFVGSAAISISNNYNKMLQYIRNINSPEAYANAIVQSYAENNKARNNTVTANSQRHTSFEETLTYGAYSLNTLYQNHLYTNIQALARNLNGKSDTLKNDIYSHYLYQNTNQTSDCKGMAYAGTYFILNDIGAFCKNLWDDHDSIGVPTDTKNTANNVILALNNIIISSWMGKKTSSSTQFYYTKNIQTITVSDTNTQAFGSEFTATNQQQFGLTIVTQPWGTGWNSFFPYYSYETGYSPDWGQLLSFWHPVSNNN